MKELLFSKRHIISSTDLSKKTGSFIERAHKETLIVFSNNRPQVALVDIDRYASLLSMVAEYIDTAEHEEIGKMVQERANDRLISVSFDELEDM